MTEGGINHDIPSVKKGDCQVRYIPDSSRLAVNIESTVSKLFGSRQNQVVKAVLDVLGIDSGVVTVADRQAMDFTLIARTTSAIALYLDSCESRTITKQFEDMKPFDRHFFNSIMEKADQLAKAIPVAGDKESPCDDQQQKENEEGSRKLPKENSNNVQDNWCRSTLYCPADNPYMMVQAPVYGSDSVVYDLEDSIPISAKEDSRMLLSAFFSAPVGALLLSGRMRVGVRINQIGSPWWSSDIQAAVAAGIRLIRVPKVESEDQLVPLFEALDTYECKYNIQKGSVEIECILETPNGIERAFPIAKSSNRISALCFGAEDYCTSLGIDRFGPEFALDYPRSRVVCSAAACNLAAYDSSWGNISDREGLEGDTKRGRQLGFTGKAVIHPGQIEIVNSIFSFTEAEVAAAQAILQTLDETGRGVYADSAGRMIDAPVIDRARKVMDSVKHMQRNERIIGS